MSPTQIYDKSLTSFQFVFVESVRQRNKFQIDHLMLIQRCKHCVRISSFSHCQHLLCYFVFQSITNNSPDVTNFSSFVENELFFLKSSPYSRSRTYSIELRKFSNIPECTFLLAKATQFHGIDDVGISDMVSRFNHFNSSTSVPNFTRLIFLSNEASTVDRWYHIVSFLIFLVFHYVFSSSTKKPNLLWSQTINDYRESCVTEK